MMVGKEVSAAFSLEVARSMLCRKRTARLFSSAFSERKT
jgi:hypothetical protein